MRRISVEKEREIVNRLTKTKKEMHNDAMELAALKRERDSAEMAARKLALREMRQEAQTAEQLRVAKEEEERAKRDAYLGLFSAKPGAAASTMLDVFGGDDDWLTADDDDDAAPKDGEEGKANMLRALDDIFSGGAPALPKKKLEAAPPPKPAAPKQSGIAAMHAAYEALLKQLGPFYARLAPEKTKEDIQAIAKKYAAQPETLKALLRKKYAVDYTMDYTNPPPKPTKPAAAPEPLTTTEDDDPDAAAGRAVAAEAEAEAEGAVGDAAATADKIASRAAALATRAEPYISKGRQAYAALANAADAALANRTARSEEFMVLQAVFSEAECVVEEAVSAGDDGAAECIADRVTLSLMTEDAHGKRLSLSLRVGLPQAYPSHLPPVCEAVDGFGAGAVGEAAAALVGLSLQMIYFEGSPSVLAGEPCLLGWAEWFRDEAHAMVFSA